MFGDWNVLTPKGKELELMEEAKKYHLDIVGFFFTRRPNNGIVDLNGRWKHFYSFANPSMSAQAGVDVRKYTYRTICVLVDI